MDASRWARIKDVFTQAITLGPEASDDVLLEVCEGDEELLSDVRPIIAEHFRLLSASTSSTSTVESTREVPNIIAGRYRVITRLGGGSFGDVYRVSDEMDGGRELALKILRSADPVAIQYFKRERRSLADIRHNNIVRVYSLHDYEHQLLFTMEVVNGLGFLRYLASQPGEERDAKLRSCLLQLAEGLETLHRRKLLHRDVKPSNVLVTPEGRLVILDFGLVRSFEEGFHSLVTLAGTPDYMAPEQAAGAAVTEASDWYAVGVMLYQSLTGQLPFKGSFVEVLHSKQFNSPAQPAELVPDVPSELNELCLRLLDRDPAKRGSYEDVIRLVGPGAYFQAREPRAPGIVGRTESLARLTDAVSASEDRPAIIHLCGPSGIGKTALLREFITRLRQDTSVLVFAGRCYEGESIPYQALDDLIDHISQYFRRLPHDHVERLLPRNFALLVRMFPVLAPFLSSDIRPAVPLSSVELRTRALSALRELFGRLRERHRIVLAIDDLQWGDVDGCAALNGLFSAPDSPAITGVLAYRSEDIASSPSLTVLRSAPAQPSNRNTTLIDLDQFNIDECRHLAESMLARQLRRETLERIFEQSEGNPFLIHEIVRWMSERDGGSVVAERFSLTDVVRSRMSQLSPEAHHFLELVAVAGQPTELPTLQLAGGTRDLLFTRDELASNRLLRSRTVHGREEVEIYHDRLRATIVSGMSPEDCELRHRELARALEATGGHDPERIAAHYHQSHDLSLCAKYALVAGRRASEVLAFNEAARFFEMALSTRVLDPGAQRIAHRECADVLANAGRGSQAAEHYIAACQDATPDEQLEWKLRAAEELLHSGHFDRGMAILLTLLQQFGLKIPGAGAFLPVDLLLRRLRLKIRGMQWLERDASEVPRKELARIDICASAATGLALVGGTRGAALQSTRLLLALRAGEPCRVARALPIEAAYRAIAGVKEERVVKQLLEQARELSERTGDPRAIALTGAMTTACDYCMGRWQNGYEHASTALEIMRDYHERLTWERDTAAIFKVVAMRWLGRWAEMKTTVPGLIEDARSRGDLYAESMLQVEYGISCELANDAPERALAGLKVLDRWSTGQAPVDLKTRESRDSSSSQSRSAVTQESQLAFLMGSKIHTLVETSLYLGNGRQALDAIVSRWPALRRSYLLQVQTVNIQMRSLLGRAAIATALVEKNESARRSLLKMAEREARAIRKQEAVWGMALAEMIQGGVESFLGHNDIAIATFRRAEQLSESSGMRLHSAVARWVQGLLMGGDTEKELAPQIDAIMLAQGIARPDRIAAVIAPGKCFS